MPRTIDTFGERLRKSRLDAGYTQSQLVVQSGIPKPTLSRYENDHVMPSLGTLARLAEALGIPEGALLPGETSREEELFNALRERGVEIRSRAHAQRIADTVVDVMRDDQAPIVRTARGKR
jgi:transcriptional regulator with XRE-family HTH domain